MAYAELDDYKNVYYGNTIPDDDFPRLAERASDFIDVLTFDRLADWLPEDERPLNKIKKCVCKLAEVYYQLELAQAQAISAASGTSTSTTGTTANTTGVITSKSSGSESISFATPSEMGNSAKTWSAIYAAAGNPEEEKKILIQKAMPYLMGIRNDDGIPILYAGVGYD